MTASATAAAHGAAALRAAAADLMFADAPEKIEKLRDCGGWAYSFDPVQVRVCVPEVNDQGDIEAGEYGEEILNYELSGPVGLIEAVVVELARVCEQLDEFRYQPPADDATATEAPSSTEATATDAPTDASGAPPASAEGGAVVNKPAGTAIDEGGDERDAEFERRLERSAEDEFTGPDVAPLCLAILLPGGHSLLDVPLLVVPAERRELCRDLRGWAAKWVERYGLAVTTERVG